MGRLSCSVKGSQLCLYTLQSPWCFVLLQTRFRSNLVCMAKSCQCFRMLCHLHSGLQSWSYVCSLASLRILRVRAAIQALLNRKARKVQKSETESACQKNGGGSESRVLGFDGWRLRRALTLPKGSDRGARLACCCLALLDNLISGAYQHPSIGAEPRNRRYLRLQKGSAMVAKMPEQLGMRRSADCHAGIKL